MNIKHMRFVLPSRMLSSVQVDARMIAEAAAQALHGHKGIKGPIVVQVQARGRPAKLIAQDVYKATSRQARIQKWGG